MPDPQFPTCQTSRPANETAAASVQPRAYARIGRQLLGPRLGPADPARAGLLPRGGQPLWATPEYHEALQSAGLVNFEAVMRSTKGCCMRALPERENWALELTVRGRRRRVFLKKHHARRDWRRPRALRGVTEGPSAARTEAENIRWLEAAGIPCMELAAYGERQASDGSLESFLITPELEGFTQLDDFLRNRFEPTSSKHPRHRDRDLSRLITQVAALARRFHEAGFNHRDLYCCHFFVREAPPGRFELRLIDLQRVQHRKALRGRWLVKDLAQLAYSAPRDRIKCTQKMAFIRQYFGVDRLRPEHKRWIRRILAKQQAMESKLGLIA